MLEWKKPEVITELAVSTLISEESLGDWTRTWPRDWTNNN